MRKLSPEQEELAQYMAATTAAFQVLVLTLERAGALERGEYQKALLGYIELSRKRHPDAVFALLEELRQALTH